MGVLTIKNSKVFGVNIWRKLRKFHLWSDTGCFIDFGCLRFQTFELAELSGSQLAVERFTSSVELQEKVRDIQTYCLLCKHLREK